MEALTTWPLPLGALPTPSLSAAVLVALLVGVAGAIYAYATRNFGYWRRRGVPFLPPLPIAGNLKDVLLFRKHIGDVLHDVYKQTKGRRFVGLFFLDQPVLFVRDTALLKRIFHRDFESFSNRSFQPTLADVMNRESLFGRKGKRWKDLRVKLSPAFTSGKLKRFFVLMDHKATNLVTFIERALQAGQALDAKETISRFTMDVVSSIGFGLDGHALQDDGDPLHSLLNSIFVFGRTLNILAIGMFAGVPLVRALNVSLVPAPLVAFLRRALWAEAARRGDGAARERRGDFLDLLLELRDKGRIAADDEDDGGDADARPAPDANAIAMEGDTLISQSFTFLSAGFDTTSTTMSFALYHLAKDEAIQDKLRDQLKDVQKEYDGKLTYEALQNVPYLDMIISETLRLYPVLPFLDRDCTKNYQVEGSDLVIEKGTIIFTSLYGIQRDPELYPDPDRFDPERFSEVNKHSIPSGGYMPFGEGPRMCIGMRLGLLQMKVGLAHIILNFKVYPCAATPVKMEYDLKSVLILPRDGVPLNFSRIQE